MNIDKIKEVISEIEEEIRVREEALSSLRRLISNGNGKTASPTEIKLSDNLVMNDSFKHVLFGVNESYVELAVKLIKANNRPLAVSEIVDQIRTLKNNPQIERRSVEATLHQHATHSKSPRLIKMAPGTYGLTTESENSAA